MISILQHFIVDDSSHLIVDAEEISCTSQGYFDKALLGNKNNCFTSLKHKGYNYEFMITLDGYEDIKFNLFHIRKSKFIFKILKESIKLFEHAKAGKPVYIYCYAKTKENRFLGRSELHECHIKIKRSQVE